jgi:hypothetical protein
MRTEGKAMRYGWAAVGLMGALSLTDCSLDRRPILSQRFVWRCEATVRSADGIVGTLSSEDGTFTNGRPFVTWFDAAEDPAEAEARVRTEWRRFLRERLDDPALPESVRARLGAAPYCLTTDTDSVTRTATQFTELSPAELTTPEIDACGAIPPPPPTCGNVAGAHPILAVMPPALAFADLPLGSPAVDRTVTYENVGDGRLCLGTPMIDRGVSPNPDDFVVVDASNCAAAPEDAPWGATVLSVTRPECFVVVRFNPSNPGLRQAELRASANDPDMPVSRVPLTGTGLGGMLALSATNLCFNVPAASYGAFPTPQHRQIVTLSNSGPGAVEVTSVAPGGAGWAVRVLHSDGTTTPPPPPSFTIPSGGSVQLRIFAAEGTVGNSTLIVQSNAATPRIETVLLGPGSGCTAP